MTSGLRLERGTAPRGRGPQVESLERRTLLATQLAFLEAVDDVSGAVRRAVDGMSRLEVSQSGIAGRHDGLFRPFVNQGDTHLRWVRGELAAATMWSVLASEVDDPDLRFALLRLGGARLESALLGSVLLEVWLDFLHLADVVLRECPFFNVEELLIRMSRVGARVEPPMTALASREPEQVEAVVADLPALTAHLTGEFAATRDAVRLSAERVEKLIRVKELVEMLTSASAMKMMLPRLSPTLPAALGMELVMTPGGVMMGTRLVVSTEWVEVMQRLVRAGILSLPSVTAVVRIESGQAMMSRAHDELPRGVRDALGEGPEVDSMRVTDKAGAGMAEAPRHHVLPREFREWFEQRGFTGELSIDRFCVRMERATHEAIHGGGDWRLGRAWPGEWNQMIMGALRDVESKAGRMLTRAEVLEVVAKRMRFYKIPMNFTAWAGG